MSEKEINETPETGTSTDPETEAVENDSQVETVSSTPADHGHDHHHDHSHDHDHDHEDDFKFEEDPTYNMEYKGECLYEVGVIVPAINEVKQVEKLFNELHSEVEMPGFRKGKAPRKLLENKMGKHVRAESVDKIVSASFEKLVTDENLRPISRPDVEGLDNVLERDQNTPLEFTLKFEVAPRCELGEYKGLEIERPVLEVTEEDISQALEGMRERLATFESIDNEASIEGDQVIIDFNGKIDGEEFPGNSAENYPYVIGSKRFFDSFEKALIGVKAEQEVTCEVQFPDNYTSEELVGKTAIFTIKVHEVKRKKLPEMDDNFAKIAGKESIDELREDVSNRIRENYADHSRRIAEHNALDQIVEKSTFEIPRSLLESSAKEYKEQEIRRLVATHMPASQIAEQEEKIFEEAKENALREIKRFVALNQVGVAEAITVGEADFEREAENIRQRTGMDMAVVQRFLQQSDQRESYQSRIFRDKAMAVILDSAKLVDKVVSREELNKQSEELDDAE